MLDSTPQPRQLKVREMTCSQDGCDKTVQARGLCGPHYGTWYRQTKRKHRYVCGECGEEYWTGRKRQKSSTFCSNRCQVKHRTKSLPQIIKTCHWCSEEYRAKAAGTKYCSTQCKTQAAESRRAQTMSPIRRAHEADDHAGVIEALRQGSTHTPEGCWEWPVTNSGYARVKWSNRTIALHRLSLEAKYGKPLGSQHAHHICANTKCVNPDHLQPATERDNKAEMMARNSYLSRIKELELALAEISPGHELLNRIPLV